MQDDARWSVLVGKKIRKGLNVNNELEGIVEM